MACEINPNDQAQHPKHPPKSAPVLHLFWLLWWLQKVQLSKLDHLALFISAKSNLQSDDGPVCFFQRADSIHESPQKHTNLWKFSPTRETRYTVVGLEGKRNIKLTCSPNKRNKYWSVTKDAEGCGADQYKQLSCHT